MSAVIIEKKLITLKSERRLLDCDTRLALYSERALAMRVSDMSPTLLVLLVALSGCHALVLDGNATAAFSNSDYSSVSVPPFVRQPVSDKFKFRKWVDTLSIIFVHLRRHWE